MSNSNRPRGQGRGTAPSNSGRRSDNNQPAWGGQNQQRQPNPDEFGPPLGPPRSQRAHRSNPPEPTSQGPPTAWGRQNPLSRTEPETKVPTSQGAPSAWGKPGESSARTKPEPQAPTSQGAPSAWGKPGGSSARSKPEPQAPTSQGAPSAWGNPSESSARSKPEPKASTSQGTPSAWGNPSESSARSKPEPKASTSQGTPSAWGKQTESSVRGKSEPQASTSKEGPGGSKEFQKRPKETQEVQPNTKYFADAATRGERARGGIHGNAENRELMNIKRTKPPHISSKRGTTGVPVNLASNYFRLPHVTEWQIYQHHVEFRPELENMRFKRLLLYQNKNILGGYLFDGASLYITRSLGQQPIEIDTVDQDGSAIKIIIRFVSLVSSLEARYIQVLNIIMKHAIRGLNLQLVSRDYFDPAAAIEIREHRLQLWPGYTTSIRQHESDLLMLAEVKHKLMRNETVLNILNRVYQEHRNNWQTEFQNAVLGMTVLTKYNNKTYRISHVEFNQSPTETFETKDGPISYIDYYQKKYGLRIEDKTQPLLIHRANERDIRGGRNELVALVPELCCATGYTEDMRRNFRLMQALAEHTRVGPSGRILKLLDLNRRLHTTNESMQVITEWQLDMERDLVKVPGRVLPREMIEFDGKSVPVDNSASWQNAFRSTKMYTSVELLRWFVIVPRICMQDTTDFIKSLINAARGMSFKIASPKVIEIPDDRANTISAALEQCCNQNPQLILNILPKNQGDKYALIKKRLIVERGVASQVVVARTIGNKRGLMSVATKVAIQINAKCGGAPWMVDIKLNNILAIGYDVCHDTNDKSKSYGAVVAADFKSSSYFSMVQAHRNGEELSNNLSLMVIAAVNNHSNLKKCLPDRIILYRDGVGEGQTNYVIEHEKQNLVDALQKLYKGSGKPLKFGFIIVSKRINTKFFRDKSNPEPGTVVDDVVTLPERYDFFLVSQMVNQGTASPTSYNVIEDTFGLPPDKLQHLTFKMTHLYYNWSGTTRVPAVCQYAHKLAFLVGQFIHTRPNAQLEKSLYFL